MTPFFFGTAERRLFGVYEPAAAVGVGKRAAVLCYPWGSEYQYAHRTMRQLAIKLSAAGFHTLRFDYYGTGDSAGDTTDADLAGWKVDVETAMAELADIVDAKRVTLIGMRLGASVAAYVAASRSNDVDALILLDPILSGSDYLLSLGVTSGIAPTDTGQTLEIRGFPLTATMTHDFQSIELRGLLASPATRTLMLATERFPSHGSLREIPAGQAAGSFAMEFMTAVRPWIEDPDSLGVVPVGVIQRIVNWLE